MSKEVIVELQNGNPMEDYQVKSDSMTGAICEVIQVAQQEATRDLAVALHRAESERLLLLIHMKRYLAGRDERRSTADSLRAFYNLINRFEASLALARADWVRRYEAAGGANLDAWPEAGLDWLLNAPEKAALLACPGGSHG